VVAGAVSTAVEARRPQASGSTAVPPVLELSVSSLSSPSRRASPFKPPRRENGFPTSPIKRMAIAPPAAAAGAALFTQPVGVASPSAALKQGTRRLSSSALPSPFFRSISSRRQDSPRLAGLDRPLPASPSPRQRRVSSGSPRHSARAAHRRPSLQDPTNREVPPSTAARNKAGALLRAASLNSLPSPRSASEGHSLGAGVLTIPRAVRQWTTDSSASGVEGVSPLTLPTGDEAVLGPEHVAPFRASTRPSPREKYLEARVGFLESQLNHVLDRLDALESHAGHLSSIFPGQHDFRSASLPEAQPTPEPKTDEAPSHTAGLKMVDSQHGLIGSSAPGFHGKLNTRHQHQKRGQGQGRGRRTSTASANAILTGQTQPVADC